jgi:hypothetical protein
MPETSDYFRIWCFESLYLCIIIVAIANFLIQIDTILDHKIQSWENVPQKRKFKKRIIFAQISSNERC